MNISYYTLGCKVNQYETEHIRMDLERVGYNTVSINDKYDISVINTCAVTGDAVSKTRAIIRKIRSLQPDSFIIITGCSADFCPQLPYDMKVSMACKENIPNIIRKRFPIDETICQPELRERTRAVVKVQEGCSQFCAYCIIPYLRNFFSSAEPEKVIKEVNELCEKNFKEIVLTGIRLGSYKNGECRFEDLVKLLLNETPIERIRFSSIEAWEITSGLLDMMSDSRIAKHLHIPLQSGSASVLKNMNRPYSPSEYRTLIEQVRNAVPNIGITTDVIVGFPEEKEEDFAESIEFIREMAFSRIHAFRFSPRKGTKAFNMGGQVEQCVKKERAHILMALADSMKQDFAEKNINKPQQVIFETLDREGWLRGYTSNYLEIKTKKDCPSNEIVTVIPNAASEGVLVW